MLQKISVVAAIAVVPFFMAADLSGVSTATPVSGAGSATSEAASTLGTYYIDRVVEGNGTTMAKAREDALNEMQIALANLDLPPNHVAVGSEIIVEYPDPPNTYVIEFRVTVWDGQGFPPPGIGRGPVGASYVSK
ncbi:MAG: hypothetical protein AAF456_06890 [Planctomycetota bacterium]